MNNMKYFLLLGSLIFVSIGKVNAETDVNALINQATSTLKEVTKLGFEWTTTEGLINSAKQALKQGKTELATTLATKALKQAENGIKQAKYSEQHWKDYFPG